MKMLKLRYFLITLISILLLSLLFNFKTKISNASKHQEYNYGHQISVVESSQVKTRQLALLSADNPDYKRFELSFLDGSFQQTSKHSPILAMTNWLKVLDDFARWIYGLFRVCYYNSPLNCRPGLLSWVWSLISNPLVWIISILFLAAIAKNTK